MPALPPYIPVKDSGFDTWLMNFATLINAAPASFGLTAGDAANINAIQAAWEAAYLPILSPSTKTKTAVSAKNAARVSAQSQARVYAQQISANPGVSTENKTALGLNPRTSSPSPITAPATNPVLLLQSASNLSAYLRYRDSAASPSVKAKPYGVIACQIFGAASASAPADVSVLPLVASATKSPVVLTFGSGDIGKQFYCRARWVVRTGLASPWSPLINFTVVGAG